MNNTLTRLLNAMAVACYNISPNLTDKYDLVFGNIPQSGNELQEDTITAARRSNKLTPANNMRRAFFVPPDYTATQSDDGRKITERHGIKICFVEAPTYKPNVVSDVVRFDAMRLEVYQIMQTFQQIGTFTDANQQAFTIEGNYTIETETLFLTPRYRALWVRFEVLTHVYLDCSDVLPETPMPTPINAQYAEFKDIPTDKDLTMLKFP
jgi:hypothetical protein